ncbi:unnamed protein product [Polarella glacialis]|uniref:Trypanosome variant surface glycoprotein C-terminal domain-containing protein n=1 Tax=Polarella glacialis TaxID=89957 RepID=A0A813D9M4_POLGL|nr:unnamed protein product [Polarella glacialis]
MTAATSSQKKAAESSQKMVDCGDSWGSFAVSCSACPHGRDGCDGGDCFWVEQVDGQGTCVEKSSQKKAAESAEPVNVQTAAPTTTAATSSQKKAAESSQKKVDCGDSWGSFAVSCSACPHGRDGCDGGDCFWVEQVDGQGTCVEKSSQKKAAESAEPVNVQTAAPTTTAATSSQKKAAESSQKKVDCGDSWGSFAVSCSACPHGRDGCDGGDCFWVEQVDGQGTCVEKSSQKKAAESAEPVNVQTAAPTTTAATSSQKKAAESSQKKVDCGDSWGSFAVSCSACPHGRDGCDGGDCFWVEQVDGQGTCVEKSSQKKAAESAEPVNVQTAAPTTTAATSSQKKAAESSQKKVDCGDSWGSFAVSCSACPHGRDGCDGGDCFWVEQADGQGTCVAK